ncbi:MAG: ORC1-type DNA replication protein [Methanobrevibacter millerae]|uniref:ORC1-type DNA replication protein n=1 Tax=Methanobrevibacter millerae TaxID=230361 RepID=A0A8T3VGF0_9EURY|nr:ORC1-type DNA replication protein [Methanobrevibacter millerae]MBE6505555.1 ORC1-type DNA replication protein [Methanobrevibacter millerae]
MGIEDILMHDESLFQNINAFDPDYLPPNYNYRDTQMEAMAMAIRPAMRGGQPSNAVILGSPATGKTTAIKKVYELVEKNTEKVVCVYINCQLHTTRFGIISQIHKKIFGFLPPETGIPFARIYEKIMLELQKNGQSLILALDDVNYLFQSNNANKLFYDILRAYEEYDGVKTAIFAILSDLEFKYAFDKNVNTVFIPQEITFPPYSYSQIEDILRDRVNAGFFPGVLGDDILEQIAMYTFDNGDLRTGINLLRSCGNIAEADASREITQEHFDKAIDSLVSVNVSQILSSLTDIERSLLRLIIESKDNITAGELGETFREKEKISYSSYARTLDKLEFLRLIDTKYTGSGSRGNSREIILRFNPDDFRI